MLQAGKHSESPQIEIRNYQRAKLFNFNTINTHSQDPVEGAHIEATLLGAAFLDFCRDRLWHKRILDFNKGMLHDPNKPGLYRQ